MDIPVTSQDLIASEAAEWFARLQDAREEGALRPEFVQWLLRSPEHLEEFLAISRVWGEVRGAGADRFSADALIAAALAEPGPDNVVALKSAGAARGTSEIKINRYRYAAAAMLTLCVAGALLWLGTERWLRPARIQTAIGEQRSVTLDDGSVVDVNTNSEVRVEFDGRERQLRLLHGEARFKVAKSAQRPFVVSTPQARIRALGTVFNVRAEPEQTAVAVLEGRVEVLEVTGAAAGAGKQTNLELTAGQQAAVNRSAGILPNAGPPLERVAAWTERRLVFREEPLAEVVTEFNRYHKEPIRIEAPGLANLRISGTFDSSDPDSLIEYFKRFENVKVEQDGDGIRLLPP